MREKLFFNSVHYIVFRCVMNILKFIILGASTCSVHTMCMSEIDMFVRFNNNKAKF